jgi:hypothetical protein
MPNRGASNMPMQGEISHVSGPVYLKKRRLPHKN